MAFCPLTFQSCYNTDVYRCLRLLDSSNYPRTSDSNYPHTSDWFFWWTLTGSQSFWIEHHQWFFSGVVCVGVSVFCKIFFLNDECANQIVFYFLFFLSNLCVGMWWAGVDIWVFSGVLCFGVSVFYKICFWMMILQIKFFFLTYVLGCDGLVWILAPRDIDNV